MSRLGSLLLDRRGRSCREIRSLVKKKLLFFLGVGKVRGKSWRVPGRAAAQALAEREDLAAFSGTCAS